MSNKLTGTSKDRRNLENFVEKNGVVENAKAPDLNIEQVDVNIPSFGNRPTQPATIKSYLKSGGGFRPDLFEPVLIACVEEMNNEEFLVNGDHRRHMWKLSFPNAKTMPCFRVKFKTKKELFEYFLLSNSKNRRALNAEEKFVSEVNAEEEQALQVAKKLKRCGLRVDMETGEASHSYVGDKWDPSIKISGFKTMILDTNVGEDYVREARDFLLSEVMSEYENNPSRLPAELLHGIAILFAVFPAFSVKDTESRDTLRSFLSTKADSVMKKNTKESPEQSAKRLEYLGKDIASAGKKVNKHPESIAQNILEKMKTGNFLDDIEDLPSSRRKLLAAINKLDAVLTGDTSLRLAIDNSWSSWCKANKLKKSEHPQFVSAVILQKKRGGRPSTFDVPSFLNAHGLVQKDWEKVQVARAEDEVKKASFTVRKKKKNPAKHRNVWNKSMTHAILQKCIKSSPNQCCTVSDFVKTAADLYPEQIKKKNGGLRQIKTEFLAEVYLHNRPDRRSSTFHESGFEIIGNGSKAVFFLAE